MFKIDMDIDEEDEEAEEDHKEMVRKIRRFKTTKDPHKEGLRFLR